VIDPRPHYLQRCCARASRGSRGVHLRAAALSALLLLASLGAAVATLRATLFQFPYRVTALFLRKLRTDSAIRMLVPTVSSASFNVYLEQPVVLIPLTPRSGVRGDFLECVAREKIDAIVWPGQAADSTRFRHARSIDALSACRTCQSIRGSPRAISWVDRGHVRRQHRRWRNPR
jgi:hypothetical protein